jgi:hypothetical protein
MDGVSVQGHILHLQVHTAHNLVTQRAVLAAPLETSVDALLNLVQVLVLMAQTPPKGDTRFVF